jgi:single-strand DNA-binding protein
MGSLNQVHLIGRVGKDCETKTVGQGTVIAKFSIATSEYYKGEEKTTWHNITAFGKLADICADHVRKGKEVYIGGKIEIDKWEKDGVKRESINIIAFQMQLLGSKSPGGNSKPEEVADALGGTVEAEDTPF